MEYRKYQEESIRDPEFVSFMLVIAYKAQLDEWRRMGMNDVITKERLNEVLATRFGFIGNDWKTDVRGNDAVESIWVVDADRFNATVSRWWDEIRETSEGKEPESDEGTKRRSGSLPPTLDKLRNSR